MKFLQNNNRAFLMLSFGLLTLSFGLIACKEDASARSETALSMPCAQLPSCISMIRSSLIRKIIANEEDSDKISLEKIQKYDLNFPGSINYKNSKEWSIFYGFSSSPEIQRLQSMISESSDGGELVFTISNRVKGLGTDAPELMVIIPEFEEKFCQSVIKDVMGIQSPKVKVAIPKINEPPNLLPHSEMAGVDGIVTLPRILKEYDWDSGCFEAQGKYYYFYTLYSF